MFIPFRDGEGAEYSIIPSITLIVLNTSRGGYPELTLIIGRIAFIRGIITKKKANPHRIRLFYFIPFQLLISFTHDWIDRTYNCHDIGNH